MEWNLEENFSMEWNMEWKTFGMEWKWNETKLPVLNMEKSSSIPFHAMLGAGSRSIKNLTASTSLPQTQMKDLIYTKWYPCSEEKFQTSGHLHYRTENKLSSWHYIAKSTLNEKCCDIKIHHNQKLYNDYCIIFDQKMFLICSNSKIWLDTVTKCIKHR